METKQKLTLLWIGAFWGAIVYSIFSDIPESTYTIWSSLQILLVFIVVSFVAIETYKAFTN